MSPPAIRIVDLAFTHPDGTRALDGLSLEIRPGERLAVFGPNGAGKTTLALHLIGIHDVQQGSVEVFGRVVAAPLLAEIRRQLQLVFADPDDQLFMPTVREDVAFGPHNAGLRGAELDAAVDGALTAMGVDALADRPPHHLSTGEKRRVAIATALALDPEILVLDEPTAGLDPLGARTLVRLLERLDHTMVVITHDLAFALEACTRAVIVDRGRIHADAPIKEILADTALLARHQMVLPYGFDRSILA